MLVRKPLWIITFVIVMAPLSAFRINAVQTAILLPKPEYALLIPDKGYEIKMTLYILDWKRCFVSDAYRIKGDWIEFNDAFRINDPEETFVTLGDYMA